MTDHAGGDRIAIVGMAGRFPGADGVAALWEMLLAGRDGIVRLTDDELLADGETRERLADPRYVRDVPVLGGHDRFDRELFGLSQREANLLDPQHRIFLEVAWEALEIAGHLDPARRQTAGVYVGLGGTVSSYLLSLLASAPELLGATAGLEHIGNDKDFLPTRVSYKLNLDGPSLAIQTACSSSLVAVHLASQGLLSGETDLALAGGVSVRVPHRRGYVHREGDIRSRDGRCRAFDGSADGMSFGSGAGAVVLKRLDDAIRDRDAIHAVILGSAVNNDGAEKLSFTAASARGQTRCVAAALAAADVGADTIGFIEAHGTGTAMGDPVEHQALREVMRAAGASRASCALGSIKSNVGHLEAAAGVAGLIKAVLAVEHGRVPPSLHFRRANPRLHLDEGPFFINTEEIAWPRSGGPRRAGVNSLGVGGTNAFVIVEEPPARPSLDASTGPRLVAFSAPSAPALDELLRRTAARLGEPGDLTLDDVAYTRNVRRPHFAERRAFAAASLEELRAAIEARIRTGDPRAVGYEQGGELEADAGAATSGRVVHLPTTPFLRRRCWFERAGDDAGEPRVAPGATHVLDWAPATPGDPRRQRITSFVVIGEAHEPAPAGLRSVALPSDADPRALIASLGDALATTAFVLAPVPRGPFTPDAAAARCVPFLRLAGALAASGCAGVAVVTRAARPVLALSLIHI